MCKLKYSKLGFQALVQRSGKNDTKVCQSTDFQTMPDILLIILFQLYRVSPIIRPTRKIRPSVIFEDDFNVSPTLKISPS